MEPSLPGLADKLDAIFEFTFKEDPFSGHVVIRSTDREISGSDYRLWTTLKVPFGTDVSEHADVLKRLTGAEEYYLMQAKGIFALGVGHVRRKTMEIGERGEEPAKMLTTEAVPLNEEEWRVLLALKGELSVEEIGAEPWAKRAEQAGVTLERFCQVAETLDCKGVLGRFSTFLEHVKPSQAGVRVTRFNGLFHWRVPKGMEERGGAEVGRHTIMTHCYWREGGERFANVNIMGVVHGSDKDLVLQHKAAIDKHLEKWYSPATTPTSSGAAAARSSPARSRPSSTRNGTPSGRTCLAPWVNLAPHGLSRSPHGFPAFLWLEPLLLGGSLCPRPRCGGRSGSDESERKALLTRQIAFEPLLGICFVKEASVEFIW